MSATIKVKCFNGKAYDVDVTTSTDTVADFQNRIAEVSNIAAERQTLLFKGQVLDPNAQLSEYPVESGVTVSVVRRVGGKAPPSSTASKAKSTPTSSAPGATGATPASQNASKGAGTPAADAVPQTMPDVGDMGGLGGMPGMVPGGGAAPDMAAMASMEAMMRNLGVGAGGGVGAAGGVGGMAGMPGMEALLGGAGGAPGAPGANGFEALMGQMPAMMKGLMQSSALQEYLNDPSKQEASRDAIMSNPMLKNLLESDPEFAKVVNDPDQWRKSMEAARSLFNEGGSPSGETESRGTASSAAKRPSAADIAPPGLNIAKLSESYGHALGQSLVNSGLGLNPDLVVKGFKSACNGGEFPMMLPEYERAMAQLQTLANEFLQEANLKDANDFFSEIKGDNQMVIIEEGKIAYERGDVEPDSEQPVALASATVLVIITAKLLDGRHFFTCPAADDTGETVHPLTLRLETAPRALAAGIKGMKETEARLLYVHPSAADGMAEMFGDLLPPNALLIFDLQVCWMFSFFFL